MVLQLSRLLNISLSHDAQRTSNKIKVIALMSLLPVVFFNTSCAPTLAQGSNNHQTELPNVAVQITPLSAEVQSAGSLQLAATLTGTDCTAVSWHASVGSISSTGLYKAPAVTKATQATVQAISEADLACWGAIGRDQPPHASATITILPATTNPNLAITTTSLPPATIGVPYNATISVSGGSQPYRWSATGVPAGLLLSTSGTISGTPTQSGAYPFQVRVTDALSHTATWASSVEVSSSQNSGNFDGPAELPRLQLPTDMSNTPASGAIRLVPAGGDLHAALDNAQCGDTIELQAGATYTGLFVVPAKPCDDQHWIIVRSSAPDASLPPDGVRVSPCYAGVSSLPGRPALNCSSTQDLLAKLLFSSAGNGPIQFANGANHYRFLGLEITRLAGSGPVGALISAQGAADQVIIDRNWVHGTSRDDTDTGVSFRGFTNAAVANSYLNDFHCTAKVGTCVDSHAVSGGCGSLPGGPYSIVNNFIEASGENILFGGGQATMTPSDIQISRNHFFKPLLWKLGNPGYVGGERGYPFIVKNHLEFKNAQRVLVEDNIFENNWGGFTQNGHSILLTPKNQYNGSANVCPMCQVTDVTIRYSTISHVAGGIVAGTSRSDGKGQASAGERYSIHDVVIDDISATKYDGGGGFLEYGNGWNANVLNSVAINHVTAFPESPGHLLILANDTTNPMMWGFTFSNNIVNGTDSPFLNGNGSKLSCAVSDVPLKSLTACFDSYSFTNNVIPSVPSWYPPSTWPAGNFFPADDSAIQFVNYNSGNGGDYHLLSTSPYKNTGSDGKDPGADIDLVEAGTAGVY